MSQALSFHLHLSGQEARNEQPYLWQWLVADSTSEFNLMNYLVQLFQDSAAQIENKIAVTRNIANKDAVCKHRILITQGSYWPLYQLAAMREESTVVLITSRSMVRLKPETSPKIPLQGYLGGQLRNYHHILPIIAKKVHQEKAQQEKLKAIKARLNFEETSHHSESGTPIRRRGPKERLGPCWKRCIPQSRRQGKNVSVYLNDSRRRSYHSSHRDNESCHQSSRSRTTEPASERRYNKRASSRRTEELLESEGSARGHWNSKVKRPKSSVEDDLSQPWSAVKMERWAMPTWCHMFNSTLTGNARVWFDDLPKETIDSYDDLKKAFLENYLQQKKCIKDPVEIHNIRQRDGESTKEFVRRYKLECRDVKGAPECMKISRFIHGITNPELIKRLHDKIPKSVDEMMRGNYGISPGRSSCP
ncbi:reverse transcriptase domain-containing protein [Tanacetum coccineum]